MTTLSKSAFLAKYTDSSGGQFPDNTSQAITAENLRNQAQDIADSLVFSDTSIQNTNIEDVGSATKVASTFILGAQKKQVKVTSAQLLNGNSVPIEIIPGPDPGQDCAIVPLMIVVMLDYNSAAYATNTTFRFEIDGIAVTATNTTILPSTTNKWVMMPIIGYDNSSFPSTKRLVLEVQSGNPTAGNSELLVTVIYTMIADEEL